MQHKIFCFREFIRTDSVTAVHRAFRLRFSKQPPTRKSICRWSHQFEQIGCLCKGKSSGRPPVSEENLRLIQETFERSSRKSTRRVSRELGIQQPTVWRVLGRRLLFNWVHLFESPCNYNVTLGRIQSTNFAVEKAIIIAYFERVLAGLTNQYCHIFPHYLTNSTIVEKRQLLNTKCRFCISL